MNLLVLSIVFLHSVSAKINLDISVGNNASDIKISYSGKNVKIVTEYEINLFGVKENILKEAIKIQLGRKPNDVYLKSPTPWGDLYKKYNWEEVKRILSIKSARVKGISKKPVLIMSHDFENTFNNTIKVNTGITQSVENTITTGWSKSSDVTISQEIDYDVSVVFAKVAGSTGLSYTYNWGENEEKSETVTIGSSSGVEAELKPGQKATAVLTASKGRVEIEVVYQAVLKGNVAVNYKKAFKDHHFYGPSIGRLMKIGGLVNDIEAVETIAIGFYSDATLKVFDKVSGLPL